MFNMKVRIYLRAIVHGKKVCLAMFDSHRRGAINNLTTDANPGDEIHWKLDRSSGITGITMISGKKAGGRIFKNNPKSTMGVFILHIPKDANIGLKDYYTEEYLIKCKLRGNKPALIIDPYIRIPPVR